MSDKKQNKKHQEEGEQHVGGRLTFGRRLTNYFLTGLMIAGPVGITLYIAWWIIGAVDNFVKPLIPAPYNPDNFLPVYIPGVGLVIAVVSIMLLGFLTANLVGRSLVQFGEKILSRLPMISTLYGGLKQIFETVMTQRSSNFQQVGLIQYPRKGLWAIVLISTKAKGEVAHKVQGDDVMGCFLPTTPNPTSGFLLFIPRKEITILDMSTEEAAKLIISAGLVTPEYQAKTEQLALQSGAKEKKISNDSKMNKNTKQSNKERKKTKGQK